MIYTCFWCLPNKLQKMVGLLGIFFLLTKVRQAPMLGIGESEHVQSNFEKERFRGKLWAWR